MAECAKGVYRPRRSRETAFFYEYLGCGDLKQGFARVRCRECGHEYLLAYSCKRRYYCTSCHTRRAVAFAEWQYGTVLWSVAHRQIVLTIPKMLRAYFRYDRRLLGDLCRVAAEVLAVSFRVLLGKPEADPGLVICVHTFGNLLNFHPHLHVMAKDGAFTSDGVFTTCRQRAWRRSRSCSATGCAGCSSAKGC